LHRIVTCPTVGGHASRRRARCVRDAWTPFRCAVRALWKKDLRPDERLARVVIPRRCHRRRNGRTNGNPRVFLVNTLFWKILVTRVNRKISRVEYGGNGRSNRAAGCCGPRRKGGSPSSGPTCAMLSLKWVAVGTIRDSGTRKFL
jgi:hypothetical protein